MGPTATMSGVASMNRGLENAGASAMAAGAVNGVCDPCGPAEVAGAEGVTALRVGAAGAPELEAEFDGVRPVVFDPPDPPLLPTRPPAAEAAAPPADPPPPPAGPRPPPLAAEPPA